MVATWQLPVDTRRGSTVRWYDGIGHDLAALRQVVAARRGAWVGWAGQGVPAQPIQVSDDLLCHPVALTAADAEDHLAGQCLSTLAPVYRNRSAIPAFHARWRDAYCAVNQRFAAEIAAAAAPGGVAWVHDYHLQLVPGQLRALRPDLLIGFLLHVPFPPIELFLQLPLRTEIMSGILGADLVGFCNDSSVRNFLDVVRRLLGLKTGADHVVVGGRTVAVGVYPTGVDVAAVTAAAADPDVRSRVAAIWKATGRPATSFLAISHLDEAEGIEQRLDAYAELLATGRLDPRYTVLINIVVPSTESPRLNALAARVDRRVGEINGDYSRLGRPVIHHSRQDIGLRERVALYSSANVLLYAPLCDGSNAVLKEFLAARAETPVPIVLSEFIERHPWPEAIPVNPHDSAAVAEAMHRAATVRPSAPRARAAPPEDLHDWAAGFLREIGACAASAAGATAMGQERVLAPTAR